MVRNRVLAKRPRIGSTAAMALTLVLPGLAAAQSNDDGPPPPPRPYNACQRDHTGSVVLGALIGAGIGALFGANIAASGHRGDGAALGAGVGAVGGGLAGSSASRCGEGPRVYSDDRGVPGYADAPPPPGYDDRPVVGAQPPGW